MVSTGGLSVKANGLVVTTGRKEGKRERERGGEKERGKEKEGEREREREREEERGNEGVRVVIYIV